MNYNDWSELIKNYYFRDANTSRVMFHITLQDLVDFARDENVEIANGRFASKQTDEFIKNDFIHKFWLEQNGNPSVEALQSKIIQIKERCFRDNQLQGLLPIVALLIMPICENDSVELHGNNYYGHLLPFLYTHHLISQRANNTNLLTKIGLDKIWRGVNRWAEENSLPFRSFEIVANNGARQYVRSLMKESLLSPSKLQRFCILFDRAGLVPKVNIEDERLLSAFNNYYGSIGISDAKYQQLMRPDFTGYLSTILREEYNRWDGTTRIKERDRTTGRIRVEAGNTCYPLLLYMNYDHLNNKCQFGFLLSYPDCDDMDYISFIPDTNQNELPEVYIKNDGYANRPFYLDVTEMDSIFAERRGGYGIHAKEDNSIKGRHVVTDYYLLRSYKGSYVATNEFIKGEFYFVAIRHEVADDFATWLSNNSATLIAEKELGDRYSIYRIEHAAVDLPTKNNLRFKNEIRCMSINNLEVKAGENTDIVYLSKLLPAQFSITGVDVSKDRIYAISVNDDHRNETKLTYDHESCLWILKVFTNHFQLQKEFQLYCNETPIPYGKTYKFIDFPLPSNFKELALDPWGGIESPTLTTGLELPPDVINKNLINWDLLDSHMKKVDSKPIASGKYHERDYLLYAITSASSKTNREGITKQWLRDIMNRLASEFAEEASHPRSDKYALDNALADYFRMGYINYAYTDEGFSITANRPTLILLTPEFERSVTSGRFGKKLLRLHVPRIITNVF